MPILFLIVVIDLIGFGIIIPLLPFYAEYFMASPTEVGLIMATYSFTQFLAAPFWGRLSDNIGRRPVLLVSLMGLAISYILLGLSDTLLLLFLARAIGGFMAGNISAAFAYAADVTTPENRAKAMGLIGAAFGVGFTLGPALGGILAGSDPLDADFKTPAYSSAVLSGVAYLLTLFFLKESLNVKTRLKTAKKHNFFRLVSQPDICILMTLTFLCTFAFAGLEATFAMWSKRQFGWGPEQNGYLFAFVGLLGAVIQGSLIGRLVKKFGEGLLMLQGSIFLFLGILLIPFASSIGVLIVAMILTGYGFSIMTPSLNSLISLKVSDQEQGEIMGVTRSTSTLARIVGPASAGLIFGVFGKDFPFYGGALIMLFVICILIVTLKRFRK